MATDFSSSAVVAGNDILITDLNTLRADTLRRAGDYEITGGTANVQTLAVDATIVAYVAGQTFTFSAGVANTGSMTLNVNSLGAKTIKKNHDVNLENGDIELAQEVTVRYDGTDFQLMSPTAIEISSANKATLTGGGSASALHTHAIAILSAQRAQNAASSTQTIAHGLSTTPKYIEVHVTSTGADAASAGVFDEVHSHGFSDGTVHKSTFSGANANGASAAIPTAGLDASFCIHIAADDGGTTNFSQVATASFDGTNVSLVWTLTGTGAATNMNIVIIAHT